MAQLIPINLCITSVVLKALHNDIEMKIPANLKLSDFNDPFVCEASDESFTIKAVHVRSYGQMSFLEKYLPTSVRLPVTGTVSIGVQIEVNFSNGVCSAVVKRSGNVFINKRTWQVDRLEYTYNMQNIGDLKSRVAYENSIKKLKRERLSLKKNSSPGLHRHNIK